MSFNKSTIDSSFSSSFDLSSDRSLSFNSLLRAASARALIAGLLSLNGLALGIKGANAQEIPDDIWERKIAITRALESDSSSEPVVPDETLSLPPAPQNDIEEGIANIESTAFDEPKKEMVSLPQEQEPENTFFWHSVIGGRTLAILTALTALGSAGYLLRKKNQSDASPESFKPRTDFSFLPAQIKEKMWSLSSKAGATISSLRDALKKKVHALKKKRENEQISDSPERNDFADKPSDEEVSSEGGDLFRLSPEEAESIPSFFDGNDQ